ncbi:DUF2726 domain-containing protein [Microvirga roseola]|uniref:DUF2726 domain-containing protein n=1 Tax=Microvirga roseola TaxID=2883126 RepID=UPI001E62D011|nr:DUF2726 domain-containing protein [Microvirga roseola]
MTGGISWSWAAACLLLIGLLVLALVWARRPRYRSQPVMTANEREFYQRLRSAFPDCEIWPQVPILALVRPDAKENSRAFWLAFRQISNARVDWVIAEDTEVIAVIELDDRSHDARKDARRDQILASCGYQVIRFHSGRRPDPQQIREAVFRSR